jgi:hypothetical protein
MHAVVALVGANTILDELVSRFPSAIICPLVQGFALVPITEPFAEELAAFSPTQSDSLAPDMAPGLATLASQLSVGGSVAYISTEYYGGPGFQEAFVWEGEAVSFSLNDSPGASSMEWPNSPISQALRKIGVIADKDKDEFDSVGLGTHRSTDRWAAAYGPPNWRQ